MMSSHATRGRRHRLPQPGSEGILAPGIEPPVALHPLFIFGDRGEVIPEPDWFPEPGLVQEIKNIKISAFNGLLEGDGSSLVQNERAKRCLRAAGPANGANLSMGCRCAGCPDLKYFVAGYGGLKRSRDKRAGGMQPRGPRRAVTGHAKNMVRALG